MPHAQFTASLLSPLQFASQRHCSSLTPSPASQAIIPPGLMVPERRLETLVEQALHAQLAACMFHNHAAGAVSLLSDYRAGVEQLPTRTVQVASFARVDCTQFASDASLRLTPPMGSDADGKGPCCLYCCVPDPAVTTLCRACWKDRRCAAPPRCCRSTVTRCGTWRSRTTGGTLPAAPKTAAPASGRCGVGCSARGCNRDLTSCARSSDLGLLQADGGPVRLGRSRSPRAERSYSIDTRCRGTPGLWFLWPGRPMTRSWPPAVRILWQAEIARACAACYKIGSNVKC